jgi:two-component system, LytTR family, sensor histidine kinase AlgZ
MGHSVQHSVAAGSASGAPAATPSPAPAVAPPGASPPEESVVRRTWRAQLEPKRLVPVLLVSLALVGAQARFGGDPLAAPLGLLLCLAFVLVAPVSWRVLFPHGPDFGHGGVRLGIYAAVGTAVVLVMTAVIPGVLDMGPTLLTNPASMLVALALFLVGGWGLARDIDHDDRLREAEARAAERGRAAERAELLALRAHLDPHFLFNTLNAIAEWCRQDGEVAERAVLRLSAMLRTILAGVRAPAWPLRAEIELLETLFTLYQLRDPDLYRLERHLPDPLPAVEVPPMLLLPLAENAVKHGPAAGHAGSVALRISVDEATRCLQVSISNPGTFRGPRPGGEGLVMVERRLALAYEGRARLSLRTAGTETIAELLLPLDGPRAEAAT